MGHRFFKTTFRFQTQNHFDFDLPKKKKKNQIILFFLSSFCPTFASTVAGLDWKAGSALRASFVKQCTQTLGSYSNWVKLSPLPITSSHLGSLLLDSSQTQLEYDDLKSFVSHNSSTQLLTSTRCNSSTRLVASPHRGWTCLLRLHSQKDLLVLEVERGVMCKVGLK